MSEPPDNVVSLASRRPVLAAMEVHFRLMVSPDGAWTIFVESPPAPNQGWCFTPAEARDFARALIEMADEAEQTTNQPR